MKSICITVILFFTLVAGSQACIVEQTHGKDLFEVFNDFFFDANDESKFSSDIELLNSTCFMRNGEDELWGAGGDTFRVDVTFRQAGLQQALGYLDASGYHELLGYHDIKNGTYSRQSETFSAYEAFRWADTIGYMGSGLQIWSSDQTENPLGNKDHFLAFTITDNAMLAVYNDFFGTSYNAEFDQVWMIAFEDLNLGDADYTDLVAVVARPIELNPVPLPGTAMLLSSALAGLVFLRRRNSDGSLEIRYFGRAVQ